MPEIRQRLTHCFASIFPNLSDDEIQSASHTSVANWDSLVTITLIIWFPLSKSWTVCGEGSRMQAKSGKQRAQRSPTKGVPRQSRPHRFTPHSRLATVLLATFPESLNSRS